MQYDKKTCYRLCSILKAVIRFPFGRFYFWVFVLLELAGFEGQTFDEVRGFDAISGWDWRCGSCARVLEF